MVYSLLGTNPTTRGGVNQISGCSVENADLVVFLVSCWRASEPELRAV